MATYRNINTSKYIETKTDDHNMINLQKKQAGWQTHKEKQKKGTATKADYVTTKRVNI